jgi:predicted Zn-dependent protease
MDNRRGGIGLGVIGAIIMAVIALFRYFGSTQVNAVTGQKQHVSISPEQEIAIGLQAEPEMEQQYGGESSNDSDRQLVSRIGQKVVEASPARKTPYKYQFHLLADQKTINAFALPGGQVFITQALLHKLQTEGELAGVLGHEVGHVVARHGAQQLAKQQLTQGLTGAAVLATYDPNNPNSRGSAAVAMMVGNLVNLKYGRNDELEADKLGVKFMADAGYDPKSMLSVMEILKASAGSGGAEFFSTHPNPDHREQRIKEDIKEAFPNGIPAGLKK